MSLSLSMSLLATVNGNEKAVVLGFTGDKQDVTETVT